MRSVTNYTLKNLCLWAGILNFSTFFSVMATPCPSRSHNRQAVTCSGVKNGPTVSAYTVAMIRSSGQCQGVAGGARAQATGTTCRAQSTGTVCGVKQTVVCTTIKPSYYVCSPNCNLSLCTAVNSENNHKPESESLHPFSIDRSHHLPEKDSQKQAVHFVAQQWSSHPKGHHYHSVPSDELLFLEQAYIDQFFTPSGDDGRLANTAPFTLTQVYVAYYMALTCIESLADLKQYEQTEIDEKIEKKKADDMQASIQASMLHQTVATPTADPAA